MINTISMVNPVKTNILVNPMNSGNKKIYGFITVTDNPVILVSY